MTKSPAKSYYFTHVYLENWRNFTRVEADLQRHVFLVGPNASGKSNLLDVFRFLCNIVSVGGGFQEAVRRRGGVSKLRCLAAQGHPNVVIRVRIDSGDQPSSTGKMPASPWEYEIQFTQDNRQRPVIRKEEVIKEGTVILDRPDDKDRSDPERLTQTYLEQVYANQEFREIAEFFLSVRYLHIVPQLIREPDRSVGRLNDPYGGDFLEQIARSPERTQNARLRRITEVLRVATPQLEKVELWRDTQGTPHLRGKYEHWRPQGAWQTEEQFSDGTLRLIGLLWATLDGTGPLLLEEPELSLHPEVTRFIPQMFARIQRRTGRQILVSTHSPDLLLDEGIGLDEVLLLQPDREGTVVRAAGDFREIRDLLEGGVSLAEAVLPHTSPQNVDQLPLFGDK